MPATFDKAENGFHASATSSTPLKLVKVPLKFLFKGLNMLSDLFFPNVIKLSFKLGYTTTLQVFKPGNVSKTYLPSKVVQLQYKSQKIVLKLNNVYFLFLKFQIQFG